MLGYPDQAFKRQDSALSLAQDVAHPFSLTLALWCGAQLRLFIKDGLPVLALVEAIVTLATEHGFSVWEAMGSVYRGWALAEQGQVEEGIAQLRQSMAACRAIGIELGRPYSLALLAEAYGKVGRIEEGLASLEEALDTVNKTGERLHEPEVYRLKGMLMLQSKVQGSKSKVKEEAEECFGKAIEIARKQQAKSWELRAATSLARLWQQQGKKAEARELLAPVYNWFTEGFDTKDLQEAKALLAELA
jgi:predicted ATPase